MLAVRFGEFVPDIEGGGGEVADPQAEFSRPARLAEAARLARPFCSAPTMQTVPSLALEGERSLRAVSVCEPRGRCLVRLRIKAAINRPFDFGCLKDEFGVLAIRESLLPARCVQGERRAGSEVPRGRAANAWMP